MQRVLVLNSGSSSLKYALYEAATSRIKYIASSGQIEAIGQKEQKIKHKYFKQDGTKEVVKLSRNNLNHEAALQECISLLSQSQDIRKSGRLSIDAVGHRVVHGGQTSSPRIVDETTLKAIRTASVLAPLHNPANLAGIETSLAYFAPKVQHVAVFDTSFHASIPAHAYLYGLPYHLFSEHGVRKYGFHGISHEYMMNRTAELLSKPVDSLNLISCHIGAGASVCCIKNGKSIDTSMGMTPLEGLVMATRCGDLDASIVFYLMEQLDVTADKVKDLLSNESGWFGLAGTKTASEIEEACKSHDKMAQLTMDVIVHRIRKYIGAYYWNLGGVVDAIVFTAGLGENWPDLRKHCLHECSNFGIELNVEKNSQAVTNGNAVKISSDKSKVGVYVIPTDEERCIAQKTLNVINRV